jgi:hypothetical protein
MNEYDRGRLYKALRQLHEAADLVGKTELGLMRDCIVRVIEMAEKGVSDLLAHDPEARPMVHFLLFGLSLCGFPQGIPGLWPVAHRWASDWEHVDCPACAAKKTELDAITGAS